jgi:hypothetical protein
MQNSRSELGVTATEDLMREHGVLCRALIVSENKLATLCYFEFSNRPNPTGQN